MIFFYICGVLVLPGLLYMSLALIAVISDLLNTKLTGGL
jgi:hypothetical protein